MIIYNVTIKIDASIAGEWLKWMQEEHLPEVLEKGCFSSYRLVRLLEVDDSEGPTYATRYYAASKADYNRYMQLHAAGLREKLQQKWGNGFIAFRSVMEVVEEQKNR